MKRTKEQWMRLLVELDVGELYAQWQKTRDRLNHQGDEVNRGSVKAENVRLTQTLVVLVVLLTCALVALLTTQCVQAQPLVAETGPNPLAVEIWEQGGTTYIATAHGSSVRISSLVDGSLVHLETYSTPGSMVDTLRVSQDDGHVYLYAGTTRTTGREWLWEIGDPSSPIELGSEAYWDHYDTYRNTASYSAVVSESRLYRAAWSVLDVHKIQLPESPILAFWDFEEGVTP